MTEPTPLPKRSVSICVLCVEPEDCREAQTCLYDRQLILDNPGEFEPAEVVPLRRRHPRNDTA